MIVFSNFVNTCNLHLSECTDSLTNHSAYWESFSGVDTDYTYGIGTDHDIPAEAYKQGCRHFKMLGKSRVFHFVNQTVKKLPTNRPDGQQKFKDKWVISFDEFRKRMNIAMPYKEVKDGIL